MCRSARADIDKKWEQNVLRCIDPGVVNRGYCLAKRRMLLLLRKKLMNGMGITTFGKDPVPEISVYKWPFYFHASRIVGYVPEEMPTLAKNIPGILYYGES